MRKIVEALKVTQRVTKSTHSEWSKRVRVSRDPPATSGFGAQSTGGEEVGSTTVIVKKQEQQVSAKILQNLAQNFGKRCCVDKRDAKDYDQGARR